MTLLHASCPKCACPRLTERHGTYEYQYAGEFVTVAGVEFCECPLCHHQLILDEQQERNRERISIANLEALASKWAATRTVELPPQPLPRQSNDGPAEDL